MIDSSVRLRRAILLRDLSLVERIIRNNPHLTQNPDFEDKSNTSLHLAAKEGTLEITVCCCSIMSRCLISSTFSIICHIF